MRIHKYTCYQSLSSRHRASCSSALLQRIKRITKRFLLLRGSGLRLSSITSSAFTPFSARQSSAPSSSPSNSCRFGSPGRGKIPLSEISIRYRMGLCLYLCLSSTFRLFDPSAVGKPSSSSSIAEDAIKIFFQKMFC